LEGFNTSDSKHDQRLGEDIRNIYDEPMLDARLINIGDIGKLSISFLLAFPIGWDRELEDRTAGLRTFPIVSLGSCGLILVANALTKGDPASTSRVLQGLVTGIGFVGGGAILKSEKTVHGTATAASIWNMAVVGTATALGHYDIAVVLVLINFFCLRLLLPFKKQLDRKS
jgi:putative Mg2+ transporter-C (MgtC) family protein